MKKLKYILVFLFVSAFAKAQQLQSYIKEAEANNPEIQAFELRYNIAEEKPTGFQIPKWVPAILWVSLKPESVRNVHE